jgi:flagellar basal-body rod protein FlgF
LENAITAALSKQIVLTRALEATANNIANQTTAGFKAERVAFREYLARIDGAGAGDPLVSLVYDSDSYTDFTAGGVEATYAPLDFAIEGEGLFAVEAETGVLYTRDGHFSLSALGELVTESGARVLDNGGSPILVDPELGELTVTSEGVLQQSGADVAALGVYRFEDQSVLTKRGDNLFAASAEPTAATNPRLRQGYIETSNVVSIAAITDMIDIMRAYEQAARVLETSDELARKAVRTLSEAA